MPHLYLLLFPPKILQCTLQKCLDSIKNQDYKNIEIIIVDNHSTDRTFEIAKKYTTAVYTFSPERSSQINYAVKKSSGKYIYRVDSDFVLEDNVISEAVEESERGDYGGILIHNTSDPSVSFWAKVRKFERDMYVLDELNVAVRFVRKEVFLSVGGFDPSLVYGEDYDLHNRIVQKHRIGRINAKEMHLGEYKSIKDIASLNYYYGKTAGTFLKKNKARGFKQISPFRKVYFKNYKKFLREPIIGIGFIVYQSVRYSSGALGLLSSKLQVARL